MDGETKFRKAVEFVLRHEGGYVDHPRDPGGATNYGISLRYLRQLGINVGDLDGDGDVDEDDIKLLDREKAIEIYRTQWWEKYRLDRIEDADVAAKVFDAMVNMGPTMGVMVLQQALRTCGKLVEVDGVLGSRTVKAVNETSPDQLLAAMREHMADFYRMLVQARPELKAFEKGWMNRAYA